ncbi:MAG: EamA family transporter [Bacteroidetes bacterium]|nr:EamA family transporter [Bacteroidota bacterium]
MGYIYVFGTILFTIYGQLILKWRFLKLGFILPESGPMDKISALIHVFFDPFILSGFFSAFIASFFWMAAMTKFEITYAYPFMSISPALVFLLGVLFLGETFTIGKLIGLMIIIVGIVVTARY